MEDDLICGLTRQVKEEVIENYLTERCIVGLQIEDIQRQAEETRLQASRAGIRLSRLAYLMTHAEMTQKLVQLLRVPPDSFWMDFVNRKFAKSVRFIRVRGFTDRSKVRKLVLEAYLRLYTWMEEYRKAHANLIEECKAVNGNINKFQKNFDLLTILNFLKNMDTQELERKQFLGENFTAEELSSIDQKLYLPPIALEGFDIPQPLSLPHPESIESRLEDLAAEVFRKYEAVVRNLLA